MDAEQLARLMAELPPYHRLRRTEDGRAWLEEVRRVPQESGAIAEFAARVADAAEVEVYHHPGQALTCRVRYALEEEPLERRLQQRLPL